tara:strand:- start:3220 stop:4005 length:786 start_codon:yes stop_codon:yes gene_type:complete
MKIYDCFMYNNENLILDIRLNHLSKYVEKFIIIESKFDHQGNLKKKFFDINQFKKFKDKIVYKIIEKFPENLSNWQRENYQRNYIEKCLNEVSDENYIMISDVDEIPNIENLEKIDKFKFTVFEQKNFSYKLNLVNQTIPIWYGSKLCKKKYLKSPQWLRNQKVKNFSFFKFYRIKWNIIKDGGWHFSFIMDPEGIQKKIKSFAHSEFNISEFTDIEKIKKRVNKNQDIFGREQKYSKIEINDSFPSYIKNNIDFFREWIL